MPIEIEAKMALDDVAGLRARLSDAGAVRETSINEVNTYFDTADAALRRSDRGLRLRIETPEDGQRRAILTFKGPRAEGELKTRPEHELVVNDGKDAKGFVEALGYQPRLTFEKHREVWHLGDCEIVIDQVPHLGHYVEIEGPSDDSVFAARSSIGLDDQPLIKAGYISLLNDYLKRENIKTDYVGF